MNALVEAAKTGDHVALHELFGPDATNMVTGDAVQDAANFKAFSEAVAQKCVPRAEGESRVILDLGAEDWPFPIPLVKQDGVWRFDVATGREEIINRHIGRDELNAIGVCRSYVEAQKQYFSEDPEGSGIQLATPANLRVRPRRKTDFAIGRPKERNPNQVHSDCSWRKLTPRGTAINQRARAGNHSMATCLKSSPARAAPRPVEKPIMLSRAT